MVIKWNPRGENEFNFSTKNSNQSHEKYEQIIDLDEWVNRTAQTNWTAGTSLCSIDRCFGFNFTYCAIKMWTMFDNVNFIVLSFFLINLNMSVEVFMTLKASMTIESKDRAQTSGKLSVNKKLRRLKLLWN